VAGPLRPPSEAAGRHQWAEGCWDKNCVQQQQRTVRSSSTCEFNVKSCGLSVVPTHHVSRGMCIRVQHCVPVHSRLIFGWLPRSPITDKIFRGMRVHPSANLATGFLTSRSGSFKDLNFEEKLIFLAFQQIETQGTVRDRIAKPIGKTAS